MVRATATELDIIEEAMQTLNLPLPQVVLKVRFVELRNSDAGVKEFAQSSGQFFKQEAGFWTGILTEQQVQGAFHILERRRDYDFQNLSEASLTTLSGRQTEFQAPDNIDVMFDLKVANGLPRSPTVDIIPYISADGDSIHLTVVPSMSEILDNDPGMFVPRAELAGQNYESPSPRFLTEPILGQLPLPHLRIYQVNTSKVLDKGETLVIGGLPWHYRGLGAGQVSIQKGNLLIFVTPTILDPAANGVHSGDKTPPAQGK
jgi:type II secretory pathway component GspD/PulD (secretin)